MSNHLSGSRRGFQTAADFSEGGILCHGCYFRHVHGGKHLLRQFFLPRTLHDLMEPGPNLPNRWQL